MRIGRLAPLLSLLFRSICCSDVASPEKSREEGELLRNALRAVAKGLQFMEDRVSEINLDGAFGCRLLEDVFHSFLESRPDIFEVEDHLRDQLDALSVKADAIANVAKQYLRINDPGYFATLGGLLDESEVLMWYPSRLTKSSLKIKPLSCSESVFNESLSDQCLHGILGSREDRSDGCTLRQECLDLMTRPGHKGYMITHQMLYFQLVEMRGCLGNLREKKIPEAFQDQLCSNVMRDAEEIARYDYPVNHRDLFMEQIGLCGMWGYKDFYRQKWLRDILQWQLESGCFTNRIPWICTDYISDWKVSDAVTGSDHRLITFTLKGLNYTKVERRNPRLTDWGSFRELLRRGLHSFSDDLSKLKIRQKREEKVLSDGCLSHKTTVALLAIATNVRFIIEDIFNAK